MNSSLRQQQGAVLIIGMIMLVLLTLMALASFNMSKGNLQIVGNQQFRNDTMRAAQQVIEAAISTPTATTTAVTSQIDVNGDGVPDVQVVVTPRIIQAQVKKNNALNLSDPGEVGCTLGTSQNFGVAGASTGNSLCASALYDLHVVATDTATSTKIELHQGAALQVPADSVCTLVAC